MYVAQGVESRARALLKAFKQASARDQQGEGEGEGEGEEGEGGKGKGKGEGKGRKGVRYSGGDAPSSGFIGFYILLQVCERVAVYAFSSSRIYALSHRAWPYHYFKFQKMKHQGLHLDSEQLREHPHHSFEAEVEFMHLLSLSSATKSGSKDGSKDASKDGGAARIDRKGGGRRVVTCIPRGRFRSRDLARCGVHDG